ncbi:unnamed protein product, partial [Mesorhabditis belari]|uniref:SOCS box domain-containing protein n=1 Tax=Mesorhabditis belari TaxID=2138241 RepID=A0AAF3E857_9BILA
MNQNTSDIEESPPMSPVEERQRKLQRELADKITECCATEELNALFAMGAQADGEVTRGLTPLHYACHSNNLTAAQVLLSTGAKVDAVDEIGCSPLHLCAEHGYDPLIRLLLTYIDSVRQFEKEVELDENGRYPSRDTIDEPLRQAIKNGHVSSAQLLLEAGFHPNALYFDGPEITLLTPNDDYYVELLELLLRFGANPNVLDRKGLSPLMIAAKRGERGRKAIEILLEHGADINQQGSSRSDFRTALHYAVLSGSLSLVRFMIEKGADVQLPCEYDKPSILDIAVLKDDPALIREIVSKGADPNRVYTYIGSALHLAACSILTFQKEILTILLENGANPNLAHKFSDGSVLKTPFVEYFRSRDVADKEVVSLLMAYGARVYLRTPSSHQAGQLRNLLKLCAQGQLDIVAVMLDLAEEDVDVKAVLRFPFPDLVKQHILEMNRSARTLEHLCRVAIREKVIPLRPGHINAFPIPAHLKKYVLGMI